MTLTPEGLRVSAPVRLPEAEVERALLSKERWLLSHADLLEPPAPAALHDGMALPFLDGEVELGVRIAHRPSVHFRPEEGRIVVTATAAGDVRGLVDKGGARDATQVFGGYGFMNETLVARHYRDSKILEVGEGTTEVQLMLIARELGL